MITIGQKVWTTFGCLRTGTVITKHQNPEYWTVQYEEGDSEIITNHFIRSTKEEALTACIANANYWQHQVEQLSHNQK